MGGGAFVNVEAGERAQHYEYKITKYFIFACVVGSMGGSLFGYDLGVSGGVTEMDYFLKEFFPGVYHRKQEHLKETDYCKYDNQILTLFTSSLYLSALVITFAASYVTRSYGRRVSIIVGSISFFVGALLNAFAQNVPMLIIGRCFLGGGIGFGNQAVPLYLSEMSPAKIRGGVGQLFQLTTCLGILIATFVNYAVERIHRPNGWRFSLGMAAIPAILMFVGGLLCPETPNSLVERGKLKEAREILEKVRGTKNVQPELDDIIDASTAAKAIQNPFGNLMKRKNRPQLIIGSIAIPAFQQLTGNNAILFYAPVLFQSLGLGSSASIVSGGITNSALFLAPFISMAFVDKWGRRTFFLEAGAEMFVYMVTVGATLAKNFGHGEALSKGISYFLIIIIFLFVLAFGRSWGPLGWLVPSEIFPLETRSASQSIVVCVNMIFTAIIAQFFLASLCHLKYGIFILFAALIVVMSLFIYFFLPETKQVPIEEVYLLFQNHWYWKRFYDEDEKEVNAATAASTEKQQE